MNKHFGGVINALMREHQWVTTGTYGTNVPPSANAATITESSYSAGLYTYSGGSDERRRAKKESKRR